MITLARICDRLVGLGIGALVLLTPLAFGSVETWATVTIESTVFVLAALWLAGRALARAGRKRRRRSRREPGAEHLAASWIPTGLEIPILVFVVIAVLQTVPLPRKVVSALSPHMSARYDRTVPGYARGPSGHLEEWLLASASQGPGEGGAGSRAGAIPADPSVRVPLSYAPAETRWRLTLFCAYALLFLIVADRYTDRDRFRRLIVWIVFVGVGVAIEGIFQKIAWNGKILWFRYPGTVARPFGPFVNSNHFAGYMELIVPLALGLLLTLLWGDQERAHRRHEAAPTDDDGDDGGEGDDSDERDERSWVKTAAWQRSREELSSRGRAWTTTSPTAKAVLLGFLLALSIGSIVLSLSRGGFLATLLTFALFGPLLVGRGGRGRSRYAMIAGVCAILVIVLGVVFWLGSSAIGERAASLAGMRSEPSFVGRFHTFGRSLGVFRDHALAGIGLGAFETAFAGYYPPGTYAVWRQVHNDYLQLLVEGGLAGLIPALAALVIFFRRHLWKAIRDRGRPLRYLALGLAMAIVSMLFHSFVDFNLQVPAVALLFVLIGGLLVASGRGRKDEETPTPSGFARRILPAAGAVVLIALAGINGVIGARRSIAEREANRMAFGSITAADEARFERALRFAPADPEVLARMGDAEILRFDNARTTADSTDSQGAHLGRARRAYDRLVAITPLWSWGWWGEGQTFARQSAVDRLKEPIPLEGLIRNSEQELPRDAKLALASYRVSIELEPNSYQLQDDLAELYKDEGLRGPALVAYERSARLMPLYYLHSFPPASELPDDIYQAIARGFTQALEDPEAVGVAEIRQGLGEMEQQRGQLAAAEKQFRAGFGTASSALMQGVLAADLGESLRLQGKLQEATPWLERGTRCDAVARQSWMGLGLIRAAQGDHCGARDAYRSAVTASPQEIWPELSYAKETALCGDEAGAIAKLNYMIGAKPPALEARQLLIDLLTKDGKLDDALEQARALLALEPENPSYQKLVAELARQAGASRGGREGT